MCTAFNYIPKKHYFGRTLDWSHSYGEEIIIIPRNFDVQFRCEKSIATHYAIMGMGIVNNGYPLLFDCVNEYGLCMAGLNFPDNAVYNAVIDGKRNITAYEIMLWVLCQCKTTDEARNLLCDVNIVNIPFSDELGLATLHWIVSDRDKSIVCEPTECGLMLYDNPTGVLANNPPFPEQLADTDRQILFSNTSSWARFGKACYITKSAEVFDNDEANVCQCFHMLSYVGMPKLKYNEQYSLYFACIDATDGVYYHKLYENHKIYKKAFSDYDLSSDKLL